MNGLALRITRAGSKKSKNSLGFAPVNITKPIEEDAGGNSLQNDFIKSSSADDQLALLKKIFDDNIVDTNTIKFVVIVFLLAEAKHPVKCFITRQVTKKANLHEPFKEILAKEIISCITQKYVHYKEYIEIVSRLATCIENFPAGSAAVKAVDKSLAEFLRDCLDCCIRTLRENTTLSPTEKNEIFNLVHLALRLLLYIIQKISTDDISIWTSMYGAIRMFIRDLVFDEDVPMDTKSVCGILYLYLHMLDNGPDSWIDILEPKPSDNNLNCLLNHEPSQLALYSALATVVPEDILHARTATGAHAVVVLTQQILDIGDRSSSESIFILGVTRSLVQISKSLDKIPDSEVGLRLIDSLLVFIWSHLEHYMDSVRHLTAQILGSVVGYCTRLEKAGNDTALNNFISALTSLDKTRKSYYVSLASLTVELGAARVMHRMPTVIHDVLHALNIQAVQASATTALEILLQKHVHQSSPEDIHDHWIEPILSYVASDSPDTAVFNILENLLAKAVAWDENIINFMLPYIKQCNTNTQYDIKCVLMLLNVTRKSGVTSKLSSENNDDEWKGVISYDVLKSAAVHAVDETRILSLSLIVESPKSTECFSSGDLSFVLWFLKYNINAQAPNFRQLTLSVMKKFVKRFKESYNVLKRERDEKCNYYIRFMEDLRQLCFDSLLPAANYSRRCVALQLLVCCETMQLEGYNRTWKPEYVEKLLLHLEDTYENNKAYALEILDKCPVELLKSGSYSTSMELRDILKQASRLKPTECVSAAYKLDFLKRKLPDHILNGEQCDVPEPVTYKLLQQLVTKLKDEVSVCERSVAAGALAAPMYGLVHCLGRLLTLIDAQAISEDDKWSTLVDDIITTCMAVNSSVASVVNNSSPEGHLPMDLTQPEGADLGNLKLEDGRPVTAQMVLLCAWRSVKEVSLLLGTITSRLTVVGEGQCGGTLTAAHLAAVGEHLRELLATTKHRGAFEQAYVGLSRLLTRLWRCRNPELHSLPREWLAALTRTLADEGGTAPATLCATRRSAGLPFMIQALVTTELQVNGNPKCFHACMATLLRVARTGACACARALDTRTHCLNILRALFRNAALDEVVAPYVARGLVVALTGFEGDTWAERNSSTLLFSALMVRIFGVGRARDPDSVCARNRMTGRIFFLRYPILYDFMLEKLREVSQSKEAQVLSPSLYPILLLLARLYPSSLEGTVSNLKLVAFIPLVVSCARSGVLKTRQLAAKAIVPLITPEQYLPHIEAMISLLTDTNIRRNYCHGILLQLTRLLHDAPPVTIEAGSRDGLGPTVRGTVWLLGQAAGTHAPCYLLADEYVKVINLLIWRFPSLVDEETTDEIMQHLSKLLFVDNVSNITAGREVCLSNALYLYLVLLNRNTKLDEISSLVNKCLEHNSYEVVLTVLNYLLILYNSLDIDNYFQEHLRLITNENVLSKLRDNPKYIHSLCGVLKTKQYMECQQKCLKVLMLENNTQERIIEIKNANKISKITDGVIIEKLIECIQNEHENLTHVYLESLSKFVTKKLENSELDVHILLDVLKVVFACSSSDNNDDIRSVVVGFLESNARVLFEINTTGLEEAKIFEFRATLYALIVTTLEDDSDTLRQRTANTILPIIGETPNIIPSKCGELLREYLECEGDAFRLLLLLALLHFRSEVCITDDVSDECRVFDQNERYNIFLEETVWTSECADKIIKHYNMNTDKKLIDTVMSVLDDPVYRKTFKNLCDTNIVILKKMIAEKNHDSFKYEAINPKIKLFIDKLNFKICTY